MQRKFTEKIKKENIKLEIEFAQRKKGWFWSIIAIDKTDKSIIIHYYPKAENKFDHIQHFPTIELAIESLLKELNESDILK